MGCFVVAGFLLASASRGPSAIAELLVLFVPFWGTQEQVRPVGRFLRLKRRGLVQESAFVGAVDTATHVGGQNPKPYFWGRESAFPSQTHQILWLSCHCWTDINQILRNNRDCQLVFVHGTNMPQTHPKWRTSAILKIQKITISPQWIDWFWRYLTMMHRHRPYQSFSKISRF